MHKTTPHALTLSLFREEGMGVGGTEIRGTIEQQYRGNTKRRALLAARTVSQFSMLSIAWSMSRLRFEREHSVPAMSSAAY